MAYQVSNHRPFWWGLAHRFDHYGFNVMPDRSDPTAGNGLPKVNLR